MESCRGRPSGVATARALGGGCRKFQNLAKLLAKLPQTLCARRCWPHGSSHAFKDTFLFLRSRTRGSQQR